MLSMMIGDDEDGSADHPPKIVGADRTLPGDVGGMRIVAVGWRVGAGWSH